jgi:hypothetical protein
MLDVLTRKGSPALTWTVVAASMLVGIILVLLIV